MPSVFGGLGPACSSRVVRSGTEMGSRTAGRWSGPRRDSILSVHQDTPQPDHFRVQDPCPSPASDRAQGFRLSRSSILVLALLWLTVFGIYRATERPLKIVDVAAVIRLPLSLLNDGDLYLDEFRAAVPAKVVVEHRGHLVSRFPWWPAVQLLPAFLFGDTGDSQAGDELVWKTQRRAARAWMALTVVLIAVAVLRLYEPRTAAMMALAFGFGSINWFVLSQLSFSNGLVEFFLAVAMLALASERPPTRLAASLSLGCAVVAVFYRLNLIPVAAVLALYVLARLKRSALIPVVTGLAVAAVMAGANHWYLGHPLGMYGIEAGKLQLPAPHLLLALQGNLISPGRGLLVFSPWVLLAVVGVVRGRSELRLLHGLLLLGCVGHLLLTSNHYDWVGGGSMGPRLTADVLPLWTMLAAAGAARLTSRRITAWIPLVLVAVSVLISAGHVFSDSYRWNRRPVPATQARDRIFDWRDALVLDPFRRTPYESRYPIRLDRPEHGLSSDGDQMSFLWQDDARPEVRYQVEILFRYLPRGRRVGQLLIDVSAPGRLEVNGASLPKPLDRSKPLAWRVIALDSEGRTQATSGWRQLLWEAAGR